MKTCVLFDHFSCYVVFSMSQSLVLPSRDCRHLMPVLYGVPRTETGLLLEEDCSGISRGRCIYDYIPAPACDTGIVCCSNFRITEGKLVRIARDHRLAAPPRPAFRPRMPTHRRIDCFIADLWPALLLRLWQQPEKNSAACFARINSGTRSFETVALRQRRVP